MMWDDSKNGKLCILVSAEATALGCNDKEISHSCFCILSSGQDPRSCAKPSTVCYSSDLCRENPIELAAPLAFSE